MGLLKGGKDEENIHFSYAVFYVFRAHDLISC